MTPSLMATHQKEHEDKEQEARPDMPFVPKKEDTELSLSQPVFSLDERLIEYEIELIREGMGLARGSITKAAKLMCLKRSTLDAKLLKYGIKKELAVASPRFRVRRNNPA